MVLVQPVASVLLEKDVVLPGLVVLVQPVASVLLEKDVVLQGFVVCIFSYYIYVNIGI